MSGHFDAHAIKRTGFIVELSGVPCDDWDQIRYLTAMTRKLGINLMCVVYAIYGSL